MMRYDLALLIIRRRDHEPPERADGEQARTASAPSHGHNRSAKRYTYGGEPSWWNQRGSFIVRVLFEPHFHGRRYRERPERNGKHRERRQE